MKKILVVDDEERIREIYTKLLTDEGFSVMAAPNVWDANEILKKDQIDLVLLDIKMPQADGSVLYDAMQLFHRESRVIVTSVYALDEQKRIIKEAADYFDKSQGLEILLTKVKNILKNGKF